jgi:hypothetical protein
MDITGGHGGSPEVAGCYCQAVLYTNSGFVLPWNQTTETFKVGLKLDNIWWKMMEVAGNGWKHPLKAATCH